MESTPPANHLWKKDEKIKKVYILSEFVTRPARQCPGPYPDPNASVVCRLLAADDAGADVGQAAAPTLRGRGVLKYPGADIRLASHPRLGHQLSRQLSILSSSSAAEAAALWSR